MRLVSVGLFFADSRNRTLLLRAEFGIRRGRFCGREQRGQFEVDSVLLFRVEFAFGLDRSAAFGFVCDKLLIVLDEVEISDEQLAPSAQ